jgi:hypothetical protein
LKQRHEEGLITENVYSDLQRAVFGKFFSDSTCGDGGFSTRPYMHISAENQIRPIPHPELCPETSKHFRTVKRVPTAVSFQCFAIPEIPL